jgi:pilus assembly protein CpaE
LKAATILLIEPDDQTAEFLSQAIEGNGRQLKHVRSGKEGLIVAWRDFVDLIITEVDLPDIDGIELIQKLRRDHRTQRTPLVALTHVSQPEKTADAMEAGVDRYLLKQPDAVEQLLQFIEGLGPAQTQLEQAAQSAGPGALIAFLGVRGGVGTSSMAVNFAHELGHKSGSEKVLLMDLDLPLGSIKGMTASTDDLSIIELTAADQPELTATEVKERIIPPKGWSLSLISGVSHPGDADQIHVTQIGPALQTLRASYRFVIADLGRSLGPISRLVLSQANLIVLVFFPDQQGLSAALEIREALFLDGITAERVVFLSNRPYPTDSLTVRTLEQQLGGSELMTVPNMGDNIALANAMHVPIRRRFPEARGTLALQEFASRAREIVSAKRTG